jgi:hypothetical protein
VDRISQEQQRHFKKTKIVALVHGCHSGNTHAALKPVPRAIWQCLIVEIKVDLFGNLHRSIRTNFTQAERSFFKSEKHAARLLL